MKNKQVTAILLSAVLALSSFMPMSSMSAFAAENPAAESTEAAAEAEFEAESPDETETVPENPAGQESGEQSEQSDMEASEDDPSEDPEEDLTEDPGEGSDEESDVTEVATDDEAADEEETEEVSEAEDTSDAITDGETVREAVIEETIEQVEKKQAALAEGVVASGTCGKNATWTLTGTEDAYTLTISGTGDTDISIVSSQWDEYYQNIETVIIEDGINKIGKELFEGFSSLQNISVPNSLTNIDFRAFAGCKSLKNIDIPNSVTSIGSTAFKMCSSLQSIIIPDGVTRIETFTFNGCESLQNISIPNSVTYIGQNAFEGCSSLQNISIPNSVTYIGTNVFLGCSSLQDIIIPDGVETIKYCTFKECSSIQSITLPNSLIGIEFSAFENCNSLQNITIPGSVTNIDTRAFKNCESLQNIVIPNSVTSIGIGAFERCKSLQSVVLPDSISCIEKESFLKCTKLQNITIPDSVTSIDVDAFGECESLQNINIPDSVTIIGYGAFYGCTKIQSITIPDGVGAIGSRTFQGCVNLKSISIPKSVTSIGNRVFEFCYRIKDIYYDGTKAEWDKIDGSTFYLDINGLLLHTSDGVFGAISAEDITLNKTSATLVKGKTLQLKATVTPADATDGKVTWKSGNTNVATVTSTGSIKAVSAGATTITAVTEGGLKASCTIKVVNPYTIKFDKNVEKKVAAKVTLTTTSKKVNPGSTLSTLPTPKYTGYYFLGWYTAKTGGTKVTAKTKPSKSMTLYAHWVKVQSLAKATVTVAACTYNTKAQKPKVTVKLGSKTLKEGTDYTLTYANNKIASKKAVVTVKGKNAYKASVKKTFTINQRDISKSPVSIKLKKTKFGYTGKAIKPGYTAAITVDGKAVNLVNGTDFKVAYKNNVRIGTASIVFTGKGNYKGTKTLKFYILKKATVTLDLNKGTGSRVTPVLPKGSQNTVEILAGEKIGKIPTPTRKGYTFVGWYTTPKATGGNLIVSGRTIFAASETKNQKIYARWKRNTYKITFKYDKNGLGLTCPFTLPQEMTYNVEKAVTLPVLTSEYAKFNGWKNVPTAVTTDKLIKKIGEKPTSGDLVLYLDYTNYAYSIEFSGGDGGSVSNGVKHCFTWFSKDTLPLVSCTPPAGKKFDKWYCTENGQYYQDGAEFDRLTTQDGTVFHFVAVWKDKKKYDVNGAVNYAVSKAHELYNDRVLCAGFVSRCIINGGKFEGFVIKEGVGDLADELTRNGFVRYNIINNGTSIYTKESEANSKISIGDVIIYYCTSEDHPKNNGEYYHWMHAALVTYIDPKNGQVYVTDTNKGGKAWVNDELAAQYRDGKHGYESKELIYYLYHFEE